MLRYKDVEKEEVIIKYLPKKESRLQEFTREISEIFSYFYEYKLSRDDIVFFFVMIHIVDFSFEEGKLSIGSNEIGQKSGDYFLDNGIKAKSIFFDYDTKLRFLLKYYKDIEHFFEENAINSKNLNEEESDYLKEAIEKGESTNKIAFYLKRTIPCLIKNYRRIYGKD